MTMTVGCRTLMLQSALRVVRRNSVDRLYSARGLFGALHFSVPRSSGVTDETRSDGCDTAFCVT